MKETRTISFVIKWFLRYIMKQNLTRVRISLFILSTTIAFFSLILNCLYFNYLLSVKELVTKAGISIASKELATLIIKCIGGGSGGLLALVIASLLRFLGHALFIGNFMMSEGTAGEPNAGSNSASGTPAAGASGAEAHSELSADSSSAPSALEERTQELILQNLEQRKGALAAGEPISEVREEVESYFQVTNQGKKFQLAQDLEKESQAQNKNKPCPATNSAFNEIKDFSSHTQDGRGGGKPTDCSSQEKGKANE